MAAEHILDLSSGWGTWVCWRFCSVFLQTMIAVDSLVECFNSQAVWAWDIMGLAFGSAISYRRTRGVFFCIHTKLKN